MAIVTTAARNDRSARLLQSTRRMALISASTGGNEGETIEDCMEIKVMELATVSDRSLIVDPGSPYARTIAQKFTQ